MTTSTAPQDLQANVPVNPMDPVPTGLSDGLSFRYERRDGTTLKNITLADSTKVWKNFTVPTSTYIILQKFLRISSTGTIGTAYREVIYNVPLGWLSGGAWKKQQYLNKGTLADYLKNMSAEERKKIKAKAEKYENLINGNL